MEAPPVVDSGPAWPLPGPLKDSVREILPGAGFSALHWATHCPGGTQAQHETADQLEGFNSGLLDSQEPGSSMMGH